MASSEVLLSVNQSDIFQLNGANAAITAETAVDFGKACHKIVLITTTDDLIVDFTNTPGGTATAASVRIPPGIPFCVESTQPIENILIKASAGVGRYTILAY